ncbi:unnamed protein product [Heterobilharzia americana]|nr:unnamed protein product [Heterobilharzia americana]
MSTKRSVYKKNSPNNKLVVYLVQRDIFDDLQNVDPVEGVVTIDKNSLKSSKVFARIRCAFRYGEQQLDDILSGVTFRKEFFIQTVQIYPIQKGVHDSFGEIQKRLVERFGDDALPFHFTLPHDIPASITLQPENTSALEDSPCGIEYVLQIFAGETQQSTVGKRNTISLAIRRLTLAVPNPDGDVYTKDVVKPFHFHSGQLHITAILPKEVFFHGESIKLQLSIDNASSNVVRRLRIQLRIKAVTGFGGRDVQLEIPFILCHSRKEQEVIKAEAPSDLVIEKFKRPKMKQHQVSEDMETQ